MSPESDTIVLRLKNFLEHTLGETTSLPGELRRILYNRDVDKQLTRQFREAPPDFIYERASLYSTAGLSIAKKLNVPVIIELNAPLALEQSTYRGNGFGDLAAKIEKTMLAQVDAVMTVSSPLRDHIMADGVESEKVHVLPNGINPQLFKPGEPDPALQARFGLGKGPVLGFLGSLRPWHGIEMFPLLLEKLVPHYPNLRLIIAGEGPLKGKLEHELSQRSLAHHVVFTGWVAHHDVPNIIRLFDVGLAPYLPLNHSFYFSPLKLFECMGCGVPMVVPRIGQIGDVVQHDETGLLYLPGDLNELVTACHRLLQDAALRQRLGQAAAKHVHDRHTWDHNAMRVTELARSIQENRRKKERAKG